jgi:L-asparaginase II
MHPLSHCGGVTATTRGMDTMTTREKEILLSACMYYMTGEMRAKVMREVPGAYNAYCGREVVKVIVP